MKEHPIDRSRWPRGPWDKEPNRQEWRDRATGLPCLIVRNPVGALCGYVGVPPGHPWHGKHYDEVDVEVHGGLTFSDGCHEDSPICHVPREGEPADVWWLGFDTGHGYDLPPAMAAHGWDWWTGTYKTMRYVRREVKELAAQVAAARVTVEQLESEP